MKIGFSIEPAQEAPTLTLPIPEPSKPVRSLVQVRFEGDGRLLTYYNDLFDLAPGDRVFVSGKLAGIPGTVEKITTKFKINLSNYERVISMVRIEIHGSYEKLIDKMVSYDSIALSPDQFRAWAKPPRAEEEEIVAGDGFEINLDDITGSDDINENVFDRAVEYCRNGNVAYISVINGIGTAFVHGTEWYEVNFRLDNALLTEMYCECPYPGLCKHLIAVAIILNGLVKEGLDTEKDFVAIDDSYFWGFVARSTNKITL